MPKGYAVKRALVATRRTSSKRDWLHAARRGVVMGTRFSLDAQATVTPAEVRDEREEPNTSAMARSRAPIQPRNPSQVRATTDAIVALKRILCTWRDGPTEEMYALAT
jgi:hypothetical protein